MEDTPPPSLILVDRASTPMAGQQTISALWISGLSTAAHAGARWAAKTAHRGGGCRRHVGATRNPRARNAHRWACPDRTDQRGEDLLAQELGLGTVRLIAGPNCVDGHQSRPLHTQGPGCPGCTGRTHRMQKKKGRKSVRAICLSRRVEAESPGPQKKGRGMAAGGELQQRRQPAHHPGQGWAAGVPSPRRSPNHSQQKRLVPPPRPFASSFP